MKPEKLDLLHKAFFVIGINTQSNTFWDGFTKSLFLFEMFSTITTIFYTLVFDSDTPLSDRLFFSTVCTSFIFLLMQIMIILNSREEFLEVVKETHLIYEIFCEKNIFQRYSIEFYENLLPILNKIIK